MPGPQTDSLPLDSQSPLTPAEVLRLRQIMREEDRRSWAFKRLRVLVPMVVACVVALWQLWAWIEKHWKYTP